MKKALENIACVSLCHTLKLSQSHTPFLLRLVVVALSASLSASFLPFSGLGSIGHCNVLALGIGGGEDGVVDGLQLLGLLLEFVKLHRACWVALQPTQNAAGSTRQRLLVLRAEEWSSPTTLHLLP